MMKEEIGDRLIKAPIGNPDFSCNAAPELTGFGRLWHDTIRGFAKYPPPGFAVPPIEDPELDNMLEINKEAKKNPDGITRVSIWEK